MIDMMSRYMWSTQPGEYGLWTEIMLSVRHFY